MYIAHWGLDRRPFDERQSAELYFPASSQQAALLKLRYLTDQRKGIAVIVGEHGLGKSLLTQVFERQSPYTPVVRLLLPHLSAAESLAYFAARIGCDLPQNPQDVSVLKVLEDKLAELAGRNIHTVFVIDDAHLLETNHLSVLRLLLNLNEAGRADFSLILTGRTQLLGRLPQVEALDTRISLRAAVTALTRQEILPYVRHRLVLCGGSPEIFTDQCADAIWKHSLGVPRRINQVCDLALLVGFVDELRAIGPIEIIAAAQELDSVIAPPMSAAA